MNSLIPAHRPISRSESHLQPPIPGGSLIHTHILVAKGMSSYNDLLVPMAHELWHALYYNWSIEHGPIQSMANGGIRRSPQPFQSKLRFTSMSRCYSGTFNANSVLLNGLEGI